MKAEKGITLVALVITIIVLLILAMVSIKLVLDSRIISHAENAADNYTAAAEEEKVELNEAANTMDNIIANLTD